MPADAATWGIAAAAAGGVIVRPFRLPEAVWAVAGAVLLVALGLLPAEDAWRGVARGTDVYLFLTGMMLLAELARAQGLFNFLAARAAARARQSAGRLFSLVFAVGTLVTVFLSNDATAVVLTPAVAAAARVAGADQPLPFLLVCAFIANAASFVLPISNPANLVIYGNHMPPLLEWLKRFAVPSMLSVAATYFVLRWSQRAALRLPVAGDVPCPALSRGGQVAAAGIALTACALMGASGLGWQLGSPSCAAALLTLGAVALCTRSAPFHVLGSISWGVLPLVAGLFVLVAALQHTGAIAALADLLHSAAQRHSSGTAWGAGALLALACNLMNNLPAGLVAGTAVQQAHAGTKVAGAVLIGVDLGPNLSVTGSLATILWLTALRREGISVSAAAFLRVGVLVMPPALVLGLAGLMLAG